MEFPRRPSVYIILGTPGSGRRKVLVDLLSEQAAGAPVFTFLPKAEPSTSLDAKLGTVLRWEWQDNAIVAPEPPRPFDPDDRIFFVTEGSRDPVDQIEAMKAWLDAADFDCARVFTFADCQLLAQHSELRVWADACVHFSDVVLLTHREGVANKWMSDFQNHFKDQCVPALFELVKGDKVKNPALVLEPQARRLSHVFDDDVDWIVAKGIEGDPDGDDLEDGEEQEVELETSTDPYFERRQNGRRVHEIPDLRPFLRPSTSAGA